MLILYHELQLNMNRSYEHWKKHTCNIIQSHVPLDLFLLVQSSGKIKQIIDARKEIATSLRNHRM